MELLTDAFWRRDAARVARELVGRTLLRRDGDGVRLFRVTETEAYLGTGDSACHAYGGRRTPRTEPLYGAPGRLYLYLCYGAHWMLNVVASSEGDPQSVLLRGVEGAPGPGLLTRMLGIDGRFRGLSVTDPDSPLQFWDDGSGAPPRSAPRIGVSSASPRDRERPLRYFL